MKEIRNFNDIKALCILNNIKVSEIPNKLGYTSLWGLKVGLKSKKKNEILKRAIDFFYPNICVNAKK